MKNLIQKVLLLLITSTLIVGCKNSSKAQTVEKSDDESEKPFQVEEELRYCAEQASKVLKVVPDQEVVPRNIAPDSREWKFVDYKDWTSGFWPGQLWYLYEFTGKEKWRSEADKFTRYLTPLSVNPANDHDLGFQVFNSFGNGYRLTDNPEYKEVILKTADTLATLFNPQVGTILSWPREVPNMEWPQHNTIMDNMINLELLFWASKNGGSSELYDMAVTHAEVTMENQFRSDYSSYHVVIYDKDTGEKIKAVTHQGNSDDSMWARGQAWAIYGYTMVYRETEDPKFLDFANKVVRPYLDRLPEDLIPYWDFDAPNIPDEPRDASAAAIVASALLELSTLTDDQSLSEEYLTKARKMLVELSRNYQSREKNSAALLHSTGHYPGGSEIDYSINYADYYYVEALLRYHKLKNGKGIVENSLKK